MSKRALGIGLACVTMLWVPCVARAAGQGEAGGGTPPGALKGSDAMSSNGDGPTGWVQAPIPRGTGVSRTPPGAGGAGAGAGQSPPGRNPGTPVHDPLPGPGGLGTAGRP